MVLSLQTVRHVDEIVARTQVTGRAPSVIAGVVRGGQIAYVSAAGENPVPGRDTQYRIGSITKSMTAAVVLGLRDEGRLSLDDPLTAHLPETGLDGVRLRQLLCHSAGMQREPRPGRSRTGARSSSRPTRTRTFITPIWRTDCSVA